MCIENKGRKYTPDDIIRQTSLNRESMYRNNLIFEKPSNYFNSTPLSNFHDSSSADVFSHHTENRCNVQLSNDNHNGNLLNQRTLVETPTRLRPNNNGSFQNHHPTSVYTTNDHHQQICGTTSDENDWNRYESYVQQNSNENVRNQPPSSMPIFFSSNKSTIRSNHILPHHIDDMNNNNNNKKNNNNHNNYQKNIVTSNNLICVACNMSFTKKYDLKGHMSTHMEVNVHKCPEKGCEWSFSNRGKLTAHQNSHHNHTKQYKCPINGCESSFATLYNLKQHLLKSISKGIVCKLCTVKYSSGNAHDKDLRGMPNELRKNSRFLKEFQELLNDEKNIRNLPTQNIDGTYNGPMSFCTDKAREAHMISVHGKDGRVVKCTYEGCDRKFFSEQRMQTHRRYHKDGERRDSNGSSDRYNNSSISSQSPPAHQTNNEYREYSNHQFLNYQNPRIIPMEKDSLINLSKLKRQNMISRRTDSYEYMSPINHGNKQNNLKLVNFPQSHCRKPLPVNNTQIQTQIGNNFNKNHNNINRNIYNNSSSSKNNNFSNMNSFQDVVDARSKFYQKSSSLSPKSTGMDINQKSTVITSPETKSDEEQTDRDNAQRNLFTYFSLSSRLNISEEEAHKQKLINDGRLTLLATRAISSISNTDLSTTSFDDTTFNTSCLDDIFIGKKLSNDISKNRNKCASLHSSPTYRCSPSTIQLGKDHQKRYNFGENFRFYDLDDESVKPLHDDDDMPIDLDNVDRCSSSTYKSLVSSTTSLNKMETVNGSEYLDLNSKKVFLNPVEQTFNNQTLNTSNSSHYDLEGDIDNFQLSNTEDDSCQNMMMTRDTTDRMLIDDSNTKLIFNQENWMLINDNNNHNKNKKENYDKIKTDEFVMEDEELEMNLERDRFICRKCDKETFLTKQLLSNHINKVHELTMHECKNCEHFNYFLSGSQLNRHQRTVHAKHNSFICLTCGKTFNRKDHLVDHENTVHQRSKDIICKICFEKFTGNNSLLRHQTNVHQGVNVINCPVDKCGVFFNSEKLVNQHVRNVHPDSIDLIITNKNDTKIDRDISNILNKNSQMKNEKFHSIHFQKKKDSLANEEILIRSNSEKRFNHSLNNWVTSEKLFDDYEMDSIDSGKVLTKDDMLDMRPVIHLKRTLNEEKINNFPEFLDLSTQTNSTKINDRRLSFNHSTNQLSDELATNVALSPVVVVNLFGCARSDYCFNKTAHGTMNKSGNSLSMIRRLHANANSNNSEDSIEVIKSTEDLEKGKIIPNQNENNILSSTSSSMVISSFPSMSKKRTLNNYYLENDHIEESSQQQQQKDADDFLSNHIEINAVDQFYSTNTQQNNNENNDNSIPIILITPSPTTSLPQSEMNTKKIEVNGTNSSTKNLTSVTSPSPSSTEQPPLSSTSSIDLSTFFPSTHVSSTVTSHNNNFINNSSTDNDNSTICKENTTNYELFDTLSTSSLFPSDYLHLESKGLLTTSNNTTFSNILTNSANDHQFVDDSNVNYHRSGYSIESDITYPSLPSDLIPPFFSRCYGEDEGSYLYN
ncbi:hypothetical protein SNEBB_000630 [Seison nebaliae]|nr:hypothetical protein SNEBB_000630 [Seison nebaliae]